MGGPAPNLRDFLDGWRLSRRWSIQHFADEVGVHQSLASKWLHPNPRRRVTPGPARLRAIADVVGVPYAQLRDLAELTGKEDADEAAAVGQAAIQSELDARLAQLGATLRPYPRPFWLAVIEACERLADALDLAVPEQPVSAPGEGAFSASDRAQNGDSQREKGPLTNPYVPGALIPSFA